MGPGFHTTKFFWNERKIFIIYIIYYSFHTTKFFWNIDITSFVASISKVSTLLSSSETWCCPHQFPSNIFVSTLLSSSETKYIRPISKWIISVSTLLSSSETLRRVSMSDGVIIGFHTTKFFWNCGCVYVEKSKKRVSTLLSSSETEYQYL